MKKRCGRCQIEKELKEFHKSKVTHDGLCYTCSECQNIVNKHWADNHRNQRNEDTRQWRKKNKIKIKKYNKQYRERFVNNSEKWKNYFNAYQKKLRESPKYRIDNNMSSAICAALKGKKLWRKWQDLVNYNIEDLLRHLELLFNKKMNWDNYGSYWEIDHVKPKSLFKYQSVENEEFGKCWSLQNLRPLEVSKNRRKYNKY